MNFKFLIIFSVFLISNVNCECPSRYKTRADIAFHKLALLSDRNFTYSKDDASFTSTCSHLKEQELVLKDFSRTCLNNLNRQIVGLLIKGGVKEIKTYCSQDKRQQFISYADCGNSAKKNNGKCLDRLTLQSKKIINAPKDKKVNYVCCAIRSLEKCCSDNFKKNSLCTPDATSNYMKMVIGFVKDVKDIMCSKFKLDSACLQSLKEIDSLPVSYSSYKSGLIPFVKIVEDF